MADNTEYSPAQREGIYRRNFTAFLFDGILFMVAMGIIGSTTVIPDFVRRLTDSEILIGFSGSLFDIGWTLPQLFIARYIIRFTNKKWWFLGPSIPVRFVILVFAGIMLLLGRDRPELILLAFFICYGLTALGDGVVAVPWADLSGTSLDNRWRARVFGWMSAATGLIMLLIVAPRIGEVLGENGPPFPQNYALLFGASGLLFALSLIPITFIHELPGGKAVKKVPSFREFIPQLGRVLREDVPYRAMVITRMLTSLFAMAQPFYIGYATVKLGLSSEVAVPTLLALQTAGSVGGALLYTWLGAHNNLMYLRLAILGASILPLSALLAGVVGPLPLYLGFLTSGLALSNLFIGYQNWVIGHASPDDRPVYAGLFNTVAAGISLLAPIIAGTIAQQISFEALFAVALLMAYAALFVTLRYIRNPRPVVLAEVAAAGIKSYSLGSDGPEY